MPKDVTEYTQRAATLRSEGRLEEAVVAARKAISLEAGDANAWWQLALAIIDKDGSPAALDALIRVTQLAPEFPLGWCKRAIAHGKGGDDDAAIACAECAIEADPEHVYGLRLLRYWLMRRGNPDDDGRRLEILRRLQDLDELDEKEHFDLGYLLTKAGEDLDAARVYEDYIRTHGGPVAHYNLSLVYRRLSRDADALDALRIARREGFDETRASEQIEALLTRLLELRRRILAGAKMTLLDRQDWYQHYVNPFVLLNVESPDELANEPKAWQKARQAVFRELELEDGKVEWIPGLTLDKSTAMVLLDTLNDPDQWAAHRLVYDNQLLCDFLMRGNLEYFLASSDVPETLELACAQAPDILQIIGPKFSAQYSLVLMRAIESQQVDVVECMMDGRRWVLPEDEEACFTAARRALLRLSEPVVALTQVSGKRSVKLIEVEAALAKGSLGKMLQLLPAEFHEVHTTVGGALRELAVDLWNHEHDADEAKAILQLGKACASRSPALAHQVAEDEKFLDEVIKEERSQEVHLTFRNSDFRITKAGVEYGGKKLAPTDIVGVRWGIVQTSRHPPTLRFALSFTGRSNNSIDLSWASTNLEEQKELWGNAVDGTLTFVVPAVLADFRKRLDEGHAEPIGPLFIEKGGIVFEVKRWLSTKKELVPWRNLRSELRNGEVMVRDRYNSKATASLPLVSTDNAFIVHLMCSEKESL